MACLLVAVATTPARAGAVLQPDSFKHYIDTFNADDVEHVVTSILDARAWDFLKTNIPLFDCPDPELEKTYYFRWWTYRKHLEQTPGGWVVTEFLPQVGWAGKYNTIDCAAGHHIYEGRWLHDPKYLDDYSRFWFRGGGNPLSYSFWAASAIWERYLVTGNAALAKDMLPYLVANFHAWEQERLDRGTPYGLFWQVDDRDGMEVSIGGTGYRPTINSYMYGDAVAISHIAALAGKTDEAAQFSKIASEIKQATVSALWNPRDRFFEVGHRTGTGAHSTGILEWKVNNDPNLTHSATPSSSHCWQADTLAALNDGKEPRNSADASIPRMTFWDHQGTSEWVQYDFPDPTELTSTQVYWFQDGAGCRAPEKWQALYRRDGKWVPVAAHGAYGCEVNQYNSVSFDRVETNGIRLEIQLQQATAQVGKPELADVRELLGYTPWYFELPGPGYEDAWKQLMDPAGFYAPYGPTTSEQRSPKFAISYEGHECQWNGPSWPYSTSVTLTAMANLLDDYHQSVVTKKDYFDVLRIYSNSQRRKLADGKVICWIDEDIDPRTGVWLARAIRHKQGDMT
jgi:hypothetical protein